MKTAERNELGAALAAEESARRREEFAQRRSSGAESQATVPPEDLSDAQKESVKTHQDEAELPPGVKRSPVRPYKLVYEVCPRCQLANEDGFQTYPVCPLPN